MNKKPLSIDSVLEKFLLNLVLLAVSLGILVRSGMFAIDSLIKFSKITGIGEIAVGFLIVAVSTSAPEISVAVFSATTGNVGLTVGDVFGSNVANIGLISGIFLILSPLRRIEIKSTGNLMPILLLASIIPLLLLLLQEGGKFIGIALLAVFGFFVYYSIKSHIKSGQGTKEAGSAKKYLFYYIIGITIVILSSRLIVESASTIAELSGVRESVIGATVIALGTSLPELIVDIAAIRKKHFELALGDIIGSCLTNITLVLGLALILSETVINFQILSTLIFFAIIAPVILFGLIRKGNLFRWQGLVLFAVYIAFLLSIYEIQRVV